jgi:WD40 repeat protein
LYSGDFGSAFPKDVLAENLIRDFRNPEHYFQNFASLSPLGLLPGLFPALQQDAEYQKLTQDFLTWSFEGWEAEVQKRSAKAQEILRDLELYIPARGDISSECLNPKAMEDHIQDFLRNNEAQVLLLLGSLGSGKSMFSQYSVHHAWSQGYLPLWMSLPSLQNPKTQAMEECLRFAGVPDAYFDVFKQRPLLIILDAYDEVRDLGNLYDSNHLENWGALSKVIITCRLEYLKGQNYKPFFKPKNGGLWERYMAPFSEIERVAYLQKYVEHRSPLWNSERYQAEIKSSSVLKELSQTPLLLKIVTELLPYIIEDTKAHRRQSVANLSQNALSISSSGIDSLNQALLHPGMIQFLADALKEKPDLEQDLWSLIEASKTKPSQSIAAANAATILNAAGIAFSGRDLCSIRIAGANLQGALCDSTNFEGADLSRVNFSGGAWLSRASFKKANLQGAGFVEWPATRYGSEVSFIAYSPNGSSVAIGSATGLIIIYDAHTLEELRTYNTGNVITALAYRPDGLELASGTYREIKVWDARGATLEALRTYKYTKHTQWYTRHSSGYVTALAYRPDGLELASAAYREITVWDTREAALEALRTYKQTGHAIEALAYRPDGLELASCFAFESTSGSGENTPVTSWGGGITVWDERGATLKALHTYNNIGYVTGLAYSPDGLELASGGGYWNSSGDWEGKITVWDTRAGGLKELRTYDDTGYVTGLAYSPDRLELASDSEHLVRNTAGKIKVWDTTAMTSYWAQRTTHNHNLNASTLAYSPDGLELASGFGWHRSEDLSCGEIRVWEVKGATLKALRTYNDTGYVTVLAYHPDGLELASAGPYGEIKVWDARGTTLKALRIYKGHASSITTLAYSPDGLELASAGGYGEIKVWDARGTTLKALRIYKSHASSITTLAYRPDGLELASGGVYLDSSRCLEGGQIKVWDARGATLKALRTYKGHANSITTLAYRPDGLELASGSLDKTLKVWDVQASNDAHALLYTVNTPSPVIRTTYHPDGQCLATRHFDGAVLQWRIVPNHPPVLFWRSSKTQMLIAQDLELEGACDLLPTYTELLKQRGATGNLSRAVTSSLTSPSPLLFSEANRPQSIATGSRVANEPTFLLPHDEEDKKRCLLM